MTAKLYHLNDDSLEFYLLVCFFFFHFFLAYILFCLSIRLTCDNCLHTARAECCKRTPTSSCTQLSHTHFVSSRKSCIHKLKWQPEQTISVLCTARDDSEHICNFHTMAGGHYGADVNFFSVRKAMNRLTGDNKRVRTNTRMTKSILIEPKKGKEEEDEGELRKRRHV